MSLNVTIPDTFNGPLGLLHSLILRDEIDIYDIPIARLLQSYLDELARMDIVNVDEGAEFLDLASRLMEIKLRLLVPPEEGEAGEEGEEDDFDPRSGLVAALLEYRRFKDAARLLGELADEQSRRFPRVSPRLEFRIVTPAAEGETDQDSLDLLSAFQGLIDRLAVPDVITTEEVPISTRVEQIEMVLREKGRTRFSFLLSGVPNRFEMLGFFIAVLELIRQGKLFARQTDGFSDIILEKREPATLKGEAAEGAGRPVFPPRRVSWCFPAVRGLAGSFLPKPSAVAVGRLVVAAPWLGEIPRHSASCRLEPRLNPPAPLFAFSLGRNHAGRPAADPARRPAKPAPFPGAFSLPSLRGKT